MGDPSSITGGNAEWCDKCKKYFNPKVEHECLVQAVSNNRERLERWLGRYKVKEDS